MERHRRRGLRRGVWKGRGGNRRRQAMSSMRHWRRRWLGFSRRQLRFQDQLQSCTMQQRAGLGCAYMRPAGLTLQVRIWSFMQQLVKQQGRG